MSDSVLPKGWSEAIPQFLWGTVTFACGFFALEYGLSGDYTKMAECLAGAITSAAIAIYWKAVWGSRGRKNMTWAMIAAGFVLLAVGIGFLAASQPGGAASSGGSSLSDPVTAVVKSSLRLQFFGDSRVPTEINSENIYSWFALFSAQIAIRAVDQDGKDVTPPDAPRFGPTWDIFVVFKNPTTYRQIIPTFSNPEKMGPTEILNPTVRSFIFHSMKEMPAGVLELKVEP